MENIFIVAAISFYVVKNYVVSWYMWREFVAIGFNPKSLANGERVPFNGGFIEGFLNAIVGGTLLLILPNGKMIFSLVVIGIAYLPWLFIEMNSIGVMIEFVFLTIAITLSECYTIRMHNMKLLGLIDHESKIH